MLPESKTPMTQYWSLEVDPEGLLSLYLNLTGVPLEDAAAQLRALHEMVVRRERINLTGAKDQPGTLVDPSAKDQPGINQESTQGSTQGSTTEFSLAKALRTYWTIRDIAFVVGVSSRDVRKRSRSWSVCRWRKISTGKVREFPLSVLPGEWQTKLLAYLDCEG